MSTPPDPLAPEAFDLLCTLVAVVRADGRCELVNSALENALCQSRRKLVQGQATDWFVDPAPLLGALQPRQGVLYTEIQLVLQARPDDVNLSKGWRASATRRLLKLKARGEYALGDDAKALETKLAGPVYHTTLRAVAVSEGDQASTARAELAEIGAVLGQYALATSFIAYVSIRQHLLLRNKPVLQQTLFVAAMLLLWEIVIWAIDGWTGQASAGMGRWLHVLIGAACWPLIVAALGRTYVAR